MSWAVKDCLLFLVANELGGKRAGWQKSVYYCGWQMSWAAKECFFILGIVGGKRVFFLFWPAQECLLLWEAKEFLP